VDLFHLAHCEITTLVSHPVAVGSIPEESVNPRETFPMFAERREVGSISLTPAPSRPGLEPEEREALRTFARQIGLGLARITLASEAHEARVAAESNEARAALFSSVTHDLRTPLASITASVTSLLDTGVEFTPGDHHELLETIRQEAERLNRLVTNFLELSRIRAGALTPSKSPVGIDEVIESVVARMRGVLSHHEVRLLIRDDLPDVPMDMVQIDQLLTNVLENAAKFSPSGTEIRISAVRWHDVVRVQISDQGSGVRPDRREKVFHPFVGDHKDNGAGAGLGLSIAHAIVLAHGGKIWIESAPSGGAAVTFELPLTG
jgi:two-component system, OmpR family, sensor histidine kinase KdpD